MKKSNYKKISKGNAYLVKQDLEELPFVCHTRKEKKWIKTFLSRHERRRGKRESQNLSDEI